jgi:Ni/Fe-hydrogenase subunit HybB-like protein
MSRVQTVKIILWIMTGFAAAVGITRFIYGLGATTNLSDATPWGLWIGFDVMAGVALAAGGFVITAIVYIMKKEEFRPIVKPAVLTAFLGYVAVIISLLFDLGLPWNIWHMLVFWNPHSPLFEVGWCVMLYTTVLLLEFSPVPLESSSRYAKIRNFLMRFRFPLVMLGIMLSTLHQSSLGSLFLIMPYKSYPLWYSEIMPILFFISAVALGLMMVTLESLATGHIYRRHAETALLSKLARAAAWVLSIYFLVRIADIIIVGKFPLIYSGSWESFLFISEIMIGFLIPIVIFSIPRFRQSLKGLWVGSIMVVFGIVFNRINTGGLTMMRATGDSYFPSWMEISISAGVISAAILAFLFAVEKFHVWETPPRHPESEPNSSPRFDRASQVWLGSPRESARTRYSLVFLFSFALAFALIPEGKTRSEGAMNIVTMPARGGDTLFIDGNRDLYGVSFPHEKHISDNGQKASCVICHHLNIPMDKNSACYRCHKSMYLPADAFGHEWHQNSKGGNIACYRCHESGKEKSAQSAEKCDQCHNDLIPPGSKIIPKQYMAPSYVDAMHGLCVKCHREKAKSIPGKEDLARCTKCHESVPPAYMRPDAPTFNNHPYYNRVLIPGA